MHINFRYFILPFYFIALLISSSCHNNAQIPNTNTAESTRDIQPQEPSILEIDNRFYGMLCRTGSILDFKLYSNGVVEFDDYPSQGPCVGSIEDVSKRRR